MAILRNQHHKSELAIVQLKKGQRGDKYCWALVQAIVGAHALFGGWKFNGWKFDDKKFELSAEFYVVSVGAASVIDRF